MGFRLAWKGLAGVAGLFERPHERWRPWVMDPAYPNDPTKGSWGFWQWRLEVAMLPRMVGVGGRLPVDGRTASDMRGDLAGYLALPAMELKDVDGAMWVVRMVWFEERCVEPFDAAHGGEGGQGGWLATVELCRNTN